MGRGPQAPDKDPGSPPDDELGPPRTVRLPKRLEALLAQEAKERALSESAVHRMILQAALDPENRMGQESYGLYLRARDVRKLRAVALGLIVSSSLVWVMSLGALGL